MPFLIGQVAVPVSAFGLVDLPSSLVTGDRERQMQTAGTTLCMYEHKSRFIQLTFPFPQNLLGLVVWGIFRMCESYHAGSVGISLGTSNFALRIFRNPHRHKEAENNVSAP